MDTPTLSPAALALGVSFDGRTYHYDQYSYERLADALAYARLDHARPGFHAPDTPRQWRPWPEPTQDERDLMAAHAIRYAGGYYWYGAYRYEQLAAALSYARHAPGLVAWARPDVEEACR